MTVLHIIQKPKNGRIVIDLPEGMAQDELEVVVSTIDMPQKHITSRKVIAEKFKGIVANSTYQVGEYDVYDQ